MPGRAYPLLPGSLSGRIFCLMVLCTTLAVVASLILHETLRQRDFAQIRERGIIASGVDIARSLSEHPDDTQRRLLAGRFMGAHSISYDPGRSPDPVLSRRLRERLPEMRKVTVMQADGELCRGMFRAESKRIVAGLKEMPAFDCWYVGYIEPSGQPRAFLINLPGYLFPNNLISDMFLAVFLLCTSALASIIISRWIARPLLDLQAAADTFALSLDPEMLPEHGPTEISAALATFNMMQKRVRVGFRQRTELLASISHDLQTPLTRLRLRLEHVRDETLRARLVSDLNATQRMVRQGLDLARSSENAEEWGWIDLDSLMQSLAEDANELGQYVSYRGTSLLLIRGKPSALTRCVGNLIENAVKYAGQAELLCSSEGGQLCIIVRDSGPGLNDALTEQMFEPFVRGEAGSKHPEGTGIGLAIARQLATTFGAQVTLHNRPVGGLDARITFTSAVQIRKLQGTTAPEERTEATVRAGATLPPLPPPAQAAGSNRLAVVAAQQIRS